MSTGLDRELNFCHWGRKIWGTLCCVRWWCCY